MTHDKTMTGAHFRALRGYLGYSQTDMADYLDVSRDTLRAWEKDSRTIPPGAAADLRDLETATASIVTQLARHYQTHEHEWPMEIPRYPDDIDSSNPTISMPGPVTLDWWKHVGIRVTEHVPGLTLDWA